MPRIIFYAGILIFVQIYLQVRQHTSLPFILSSSISCVDDVIEAHWSQACDVMRLNLSQLGGICKALQV